jgi:hypothetical protein
MTRFHEPRWRVSRADVASISERLTNEITQQLVTLLGPGNLPEVTARVRRILESELEALERRRTTHRVA